MAGEQLFQPDRSFAAGWYVEDPLAQGALKHASVLILDVLDEAQREISETDPDLGDFGPLGLLPAAVRPAMTPLLIEKLKAAATIIGWKLAQPGVPIRPGCVAEELALEMIRQEAVGALELVDAPSSSIGATRGVFEVCQDDDILDLFAMEEPADAAVALTDPINIQMGKADMRIAKWFEPFYGGSEGCAPHPLYLEKPSTPSYSRRLEIVAPEPGFKGNGSPYDARFRVSLRMWDDPLPGDDEEEGIPPNWLYYLDAPNADAARAMALDLFPEGATQSTVFDSADEVRIDRDEIARLSIDVQRIGLSQALKGGAAFHVVGDLAEDVPDDQMGRLAGHLTSIFPVALIARDGKDRVFAVTVNAESFEEAEADLFDAMVEFGASIGLEHDLANGLSCGPGKRNKDQLITEIISYRQSLPRSHREQ